MLSSLMKRCSFFTTNPLVYEPITSSLEYSPYKVREKVGTLVHNFQATTSKQVRFTQLVWEHFFKWQEFCFRIFQGVLFGSKGWCFLAPLIIHDPHPNWKIQVSIFFVCFFYDLRSPNGPKELMTSNVRRTPSGKWPFAGMNGTHRETWGYFNKRNRGCFFFGGIVNRHWKHTIRSHVSDIPIIPFPKVCRSINKKSLVEDDEVFGNQHLQRGAN